MKTTASTTASSPFMGNHRLVKTVMTKLLMLNSNFTLNFFQRELLRQSKESAKIVSYSMFIQIKFLLKTKQKLEKFFLKLKLCLTIFFNLSNQMFQKMNFKKCQSTNVDIKTHLVKIKVIVVLVVECIEKEINNLNITKYANNVKTNTINYAAKTCKENDV